MLLSAMGWRSFKLAACFAEIGVAFFLSVGEPASRCLAPAPHALHVASEGAGQQLLGSEIGETGPMYYNQFFAKQVVAACPTQILAEAGVAGDPERSARSDAAGEEALGQLGRRWAHLLFDFDFYSFPAL